MQQQTKLIGCEAMTGRAIRFQVQFVIFDLVFRLSTSTVNLLGEHLGAGLLQIGHHKAGVDALLGDLDLDHHTTRAPPRPRLVARRVEAGDLPATVRLGPLGLLDDLLGQLLQHGVACQAGHIAHVGLLCNPLHHLRVGKVAVAAHDQ
jgi:hypothetical protein